MYLSYIQLISCPDQQTPLGIFPNRVRAWD